MLTDEQIEQILYKYTRQQDEFNMSVLGTIAGRVSTIDDIDMLSKGEISEIMRTDIAKINAEYRKYLKKQLEQLRDDFWWIIIVLYSEATVYYTNQIALKENDELIKAMQKSLQVAQESLKQALKYPVFVIRDLKNASTLRPYNLSQTYQTVVNEALSYNNVSKELRDIALKRTETQLFESGVRYALNNSSNDLGDVRNANVAVRFNVLDSVKNLIDKVQKIMGKQFGANAVELSAHIFPAPDHAPAQGHQFSFAEVEKMQNGDNFEDLDGHIYAGFERNIGQWNCRHYFMQIKKGAKPQHSQKELDKILSDNANGYVDEHGRHRTLYECTQVQRRYEREIRKAKEKYLYGKALNDSAIMANARNRVGKLTTAYKQFSRKCDIPAKLERIRVKGYQ